MNVGNFDQQARRAQMRVVSEAKNAIIAISQELHAELVERSADKGEPGGSPVASGRYAASINVALNHIDRSTAPEDRNYRYPDASVHKYDADNLPARTRANVPASRVAMLLRTFKLGDTIYFSNAVPYARKIEDAKHSWQTRAGGFEVTTRAVVARFRNIKLRVFRRG